jgi:bifunctional UDP-N-acetylglucosamine pyrophosphorylase/glucosamine-1-phosphate N-acetyltransferase
VIENGVTILGDTTIISSHIKAHSVIEDSKIEDSSIGPFARIRPNSNIKDTHIGNFVEVKKSTLDGVKAGHLSYLGDSNIKSGTNIGAGTITCNYDGIKKYKTNIGQNVFIGSGSLIVSPINIESNSMVGAGSVVTKDIKDGELFIRRSDIKIIPKYYYKHFKKTK